MYHSHQTIVKRIAHQTKIGQLSGIFILFCPSNVWKMVHSSVAALFSPVLHVCRPPSCTTLAET